MFFVGWAQISSGPSLGSVAGFTFVTSWIGEAKTVDAQTADRT